MYKTKTIAAIAIILIIASMLIFEMPAKAAGIVQIGGSPTGVVGMPNLKPIPSGVTPQYTIETRAYLSFRPNPIGVGQSLLVNIWTSPGMYHSFYMCDNIVTIQKPDGTTEKIGPWNSYLGDATGWFEYVVDQPGTWRFKYESPGTYLPAGVYMDRPGNPGTNYNLGASVWYLPSSTDWQNLTVQENLVASWPGSPLPTDYWNRPANVINREWYSILGGFPWTGAYYYGNSVYYGNSRDRFYQYVLAPNSAHIVWKRLDSLSGVIGGDAYFNSLSSTPSTPSIIYAGRAYQSYSKPGTGKTAVTYWSCYDIRTGQLYWERPLETGESAPTNIEINAPQPSASVPGAEASVSYSVSLISISNGYMRKYDPFDGEMASNISISPLTSAGIFYNNELALTVQTVGSGANAKYYLINWTTRGTSTNFTSRIISNITWPKSSLGTVDLVEGISYSAGWTNPPGPQWCIGVTIQTVDMRTGNSLWNYLTNDTITESIQGGQSLIHKGRIAIGAHGRHWTCWNARTGQRLWVSEQTEYPWGAWWPYNQALVVYNETKSAIITSSYEGVYAIDWDDGKILWHYKDSNSVPFENPYDATPYFTAVNIGDGKVFAFNGEHTPSNPRARDWKIHAINVTTGELIWKMLNPMTPGAMADGYLTAGNSYDGYMYVFGKGKSATTVSAPDLVIQKGQGIVIKGTVLDLSPAQPNTPCVSKDSMSTQMQYLHIQVPIDGIWHNETITGVPVALTAIDSSNNVIDIGTIVTNGYYGTFSKSWTPPSEGDYTIIASFAGDDSYGSSAAATGISVGTGPTTAPTTTIIPSTAQVDLQPIVMYIVGIGIAIIIAIAIVGVLVLRKR